MPTRASKHSVSNPTAIRAFAALLVAICCGLTVWYLTSSKTELNDQEYDLTVALYRVCNLRSEEGLVKIEDVLQQNVSSPESLTVQQAELDSIVQDARAGRWDAAMQACRDLLEDQVQR